MPLLRRESIDSYFKNECKGAPATWIKIKLCGNFNSWIRLINERHFESEKRSMKIVPTQLLIFVWKNILLLNTCERLYNVLNCSKTSSLGVLIVMILLLRNKSPIEILYLSHLCQFDKYLQNLIRMWKLNYFKTFHRVTFSRNTFNWTVTYWT